ncbi:MAG TPA: DUF4013 domain-containing protein, partial [Roseiflexaceae bacterium]
MDIGKAFSFVFEDEEWVSKVLLGGLIALIPLIGQITVVGYSLKVAQNVAQGNPRPLPTWSEFGDHLMRGLYEFVIRLVYALPIIVVAAIFVCAIALAGGATANRRDGSGGALAGTLSLCLVPLMVILGLAISVVLYAAVARFVVTNRLGEALKFAEVIALVRRNVGPWEMMLVVALLASFVAGLGL